MWPGNETFIMRDFIGTFCAYCNVCLSYDMKSCVFTSSTKD